MAVWAGESEVELAQDSLSGERKKISNVCSCKSYEGFVAKLLMRIKGHYNAHKLWPLSATIFMLSILPKLGAKMPTRLLGAAATVLVTPRTLPLLIFISPGTNALGERIFFTCKLLPVLVIILNILLCQWRHFFPTWHTNFYSLRYL